MATYLPPGARMRQIKDAARAALEAKEPKAPEPVPAPAPEPVAEPASEPVAEAAPVAPAPEPKAEKKVKAPQFDASMKKAELLAVAKKAKVEVPEDATKAQILALLSDRFPG